MNRARRQAIVVAGLMVGSFTAAAAWRPRTKLADQRERVDLERIFPSKFADWQLDDRMPVQLISPDTQALLNKLYNQTLSRTYVNGEGARIMLSVAYGGDQSDATRAHRPEVCYPAQGFQMLGSSTGPLPLRQGMIPVRRLVARLGGRNEPITYWIVVGDKVTVTGTEMKLAQLSYSTRGIIPDGMLVRVSNISSENQQSFRLHERFVNDLAGVLTDQWRAHVVGAGV